MYYLCSQNMVCLYTTGSGSQGGSTNPTAPTGTRQRVAPDSGMTPSSCSNSMHQEPACGNSQPYPVIPTTSTEDIKFTLLRSLITGEMLQEPASPLQPAHSKTQSGGEELQPHNTSIGKGQIIQPTAELYLVICNVCCKGSL